MRLRYVKNARERIENNPNLIIDMQEKRHIDLDQLFSEKQPVHIEIGMGKGKFILTLAKENPKVNYIGIEKFDSAIVKALEVLIEEPLPNVKLMRADAIDLTTFFSPNTIGRIYLNFSDPWPKERHVKRRLTSKRFLSMYEKVIQKNGELHFKTDNLPFFDYSLDSVKAYPMELQFVTFDLHQEDVPNIMTEFEEKFSQKGFKINKLIAMFKEDNNG